MLQFERRQSILEYLKEHHSAKIAQLAAGIYTSEASVRRDLAVLESEGLVQRVYGGVVLAQFKNDVIPPELRESANSAAKEAIAEKAAELIHDGDTVLFDSSSTVRRICPHIKKRKNLKVITNNVRICRELQDTDITVYVTGGEYFKKRHCFLGPYAESFLRTVNADSAFFSCKGLSDSGFITDVSEDEISLRSVMLRQAENSYFLCDDSKLGVRCTFSLCHASQVTQVLSNVPLPEFPTPQTK